MNDGFKFKPMERATIVSKIPDGYELIWFTPGDKKRQGDALIRCNSCGCEFKTSRQTLQPSYRFKWGCPQCKRNEIVERAVIRKTVSEGLKDSRRAEKKEARETSKRIKRAQRFRAAQKLMVCEVCGQSLFTNRSNMKTCSKECAKKRENKNPDSRLNQCEVVDYTITLTKLINRDNNVCHICGEPCDSNDIEARDNGVMVAGNGYPSIDHVIPISKGGNHSWDNVRLAHRICNTIKYNRTDPAP